MLQASRGLARTLLTALTALGLFLGMGSGAAQAHPLGPADDRMLSVPISWWTSVGVDAVGAMNLVNNNNARPVDLRVTSVSPLRYSITAVRNTGAYATAWWMYFNVTASDVNAKLGLHNARLISAVRHGSNYSVVMVPNSGANYRQWRWCDSDFSGVQTCLGSSYRLTNIVGYQQGRYVTIMVALDGHGWCWGAGLSKTSAANWCTGHSTLDISANPDGTFNVATLDMRDGATGGDGRVKYFDTVTALINYCLAPPPDRPLMVTPFIEGGVTKWATSVRHNS